MLPSSEPGSLPAVGRAALLSAWPEPALRLDAAGAIVERNAAAAELDDEVLAPIRAAPRPSGEGRTVTVDLARTDARGTSRAWRATLVPTDDGGTLALLTEITELVREREQLRRNEALLVDLQGTASLGTWEWDVTEPHAHWSPGLYAIYGLDPASHVPTYEDYLTRVHPEDRARVAEATRRVFEDHVSYSHDERILRADGAWRYLHTWAHPVVDDAGRLVRLVGVCQDVTEARTAELRLATREARLRALFELAPLGKCTVAADSGEVLESNPAVVTLLGRDLVGTRLVDAVHVDDRARLADALALDPLWGHVVACRVQRADGVLLQCHLTLARVETGPDEPPFVLVGIEDVTALDRAEEVRRLAVHTAQKSAEDLVRIVSHELRNPLQPLTIQAQMLQEGRLGALNERQQRAATAILTQSRRLGELVGDLLDAARAQSGGVGEEATDVALADAVDEVVESLGPLATSWSVGLRREVDRSVTVRGHPLRLRQVLYNLLGNAMKFAPAGTDVLVSSAREGDHVVLRVVDRGPGLTAEQIAGLFAPFARMHADDVGRGRGTGLGLYVAKAIVTAHGGDIGVESEGPGHGSTFWVRLPLAGAERASG
jgi:PAS domain S-box-containing protein